MQYYTTYTSPVGELTISADGESLTGLWIAGQKYFLDTLPEEPIRQDSLSVFGAAAAWLDAYFAGRQPQISDLPLAPMGSDFRQAVWQILCEIPYGSVTTYGAIAAQIAEQRGLGSMSAQAVGGAVGHNPISIIIPCHRVVGASGSLTGYAGGIEKKIALLKLEGVDTEQFFIPSKGTAL